MKGWQILIHSVRLVFRNLDAALRVSLVPYVISGVAMVLLALPAMRVMTTGAPEAMVQIAPSVWTNFILYMVIYGIVALWIAVAWHRYVLLEEMPQGWIPTFHGAPMLGYFLKGLLIMGAIVLSVLITSVILGLAIGWAGPLGASIVAMGTVAVGTYIFYRLCPMLPSAAVGEPMRLNDALDATKGASGTIAVLVALVLIASFIIQLPTMFGAADSAFALAYSFVINWLSMLVGVSVLTTFYGHYVEGRSID